jgi:fucose 4-O-acetylase-like acetyltransferase
MALEKVKAADRTRLLDVDRAKGLAIFLVVLGHLFISYVPAGGEWYFQLKYVIYKFHMSFFMFLTGLVMFYTYPGIETIGDYFTYAKKKFIRLIPAYLLFAVVVWAGKFLFAKFSNIERPVTGMVDCVAVFIRPAYSHNSNLWYIYVCFIYFLTIPIMLKIVKHKVAIILALAFLLHFMPSTRYFALDYVFEYLFFFLLGGYAACHLHLYTRFIDRYSYILVTIFAATLVLAFLVNIPKMVMGLLCLPALHSLVRWKAFERSFLLRTFGEYTFPIYLMNTMAIGFPREMMRKYMLWDSTGLVVVALVLLISGLLLPIVAQNLFISRIPVLRSIIR